MRASQQQLNRDLLDNIWMRDFAGTQELLKKGAKVNSRDREHNETALMLAVKAGSAQIVKLLIDARADVNARDDYGRTALFYTSPGSDVFDSLIAAGADIHVRDAEGHTILMRQVSASASLSEVEKLLQLGVDRNQQANDGETALDIAERLGLLRIAEQLRLSG